ncbi:hypothetical protein C9374_011241 [Naegleria lovaniensis]|uniref:GrpE protein homolog n=1 Tax=Naegleria lovaniensis TaxID=51637 RepID=A0AA88H424_NAELO|nr:uncharacterized protein C9374_011241 [Naegleria lovaniensis]KAG2392516.1 hypothetical protein C9374_011241 [Naegleria lovaniensis]
MMHSTSKCLASLLKAGTTHSRSSVMMMKKSSAALTTARTNIFSTTQTRNVFGFGNSNTNNSGASWEQQASSSSQQTQQQQTNNNTTAQQTQQNNNNTTTQQQQTPSVEKEQTQTQEQTKQQQTQAVDDAKVKELEKEIEALKEKNNKLDDQLKRAVAEMQNVRRIAKNDVDNAKKFALQSFSKNLLEVVDNLETGLKHLNIEDVSEIVKLVQDSPDCTEDLRKKSKALLTSVEGVKMTETVLLKVLERNGVTKLEIGEQTTFDPNFHEAMMKIPPSDKHPNGSVAMVLKSGWVLNERVLRPAQVVVAIQD